MYIERLHIDRFGVLVDQDVPNLSSGITLFTGHNEAGKSTCLNFFRSMLFGYKRGKSSLDPVARSKSKDASGGSLFLHTASHGALTLTRRPDKNNGLSLSGSDGHLLPESVLQQLLGNMTLEVFDNIFAFSLDELMELKSLDGDSIRHALHGAAFGLGLQSPVQVLKTLDVRMKELLKSDTAAASAAINNIVRELRAAQEELRTTQPDMERYASVQARLEELEAVLVTEKIARTTNERALRRIERRLTVWQQGEETRRIQAELLALTQLATEKSTKKDANGTPLLPLFSDDALQRLENLLLQKEERRVAVEEQQHTQHMLAKEIADLTLQSRHAALAPTLHSLREQKDRRRNDAEQLPMLHTECAGLTTAQEEVLTRLGSNWTPEAIATADTSLFAQNTVRQFGTALQEKTDAVRLLTAERKQHETLVAQAQEQERLVADRVAAYPLSAAPLPDRPVIERITAALTRARAAYTTLPSVFLRNRQAAEGAAQSLVDIAPAWTPEILAQCDTSLREQQEVRACSARLTQTASVVEREEHACALAATNLAALQEEAKHMHARCEQYNDLPDQPTLDTRASLLRALERSRIALTEAQTSYTAAAQAAAAYTPLQPPKKYLLLNPLFIVGVLLLLLGGATGILSRTLLLETPEAHLLLCGGGATAFLGIIACLLAALLAKRTATPQTDPHEASLNHVRNAAEHKLAASTEQLAQLAAQATSAAHECAVPNAHTSAVGWLAALQPLAPTLAEIERSMALHEEYRRKQALQERDVQDASRLQQALAAAQQHHAEATLQLQHATTAQQEAQQAWQAKLRQLFLAETTHPEATSGIFDRIEAARVKQTTAQEAAHSLALALEAISQCAQNALQIPFFSASDAASLQTATTLTAKNDEKTCLAHADEALAALEKSLAQVHQLKEKEQERAQHVAILAEKQNALQRAAQQLASIVALHNAAVSEQQATETHWRQWLAQQQLPETLAPETAMQALQAMLDFLAREKTLAERQRQYNTMLQGLQQFRQDVLALAEAAAYPVPDALLPSEQKQSLGATMPPLLQLLDAVTHSIESAVQAHTLHAEKAEQLQQQQQAFVRLQAALHSTEESLASLLQAAGTQGAEEFRTAFSHWQQLQHLQRQERNLLAGMHSLATEEGITVEDVLASLETTTFDALQEEAVALREQLAAADEEIRTQTEERGQLRERQDALLHGEGTAHLRRQEAALQEELHRLSRQWSVLAMAKEFLLTAKAKFEEEGQQGVIRFAGDIFSGITDGEYTGIVADLEGKGFTAIHASGDRRDVEKHLSQGTREQLYLALRLAYVKNHAVNAEALPLIMDDILVNFDPTRAANTGKVLSRFARDNQILFFSCHPSTTAMLYDIAQTEAAATASAPPASFLVNKGNITRQIL